MQKQVLRAIQPGESDAPEEGQVTQQQYYTVFMSEDEWRKAYDIAEVCLSFAVILVIMHVRSKESSSSTGSANSSHRLQW
jgi:hypothetical protein